MLLSDVPRIERKNGVEVSPQYSEFLTPITFRFLIHLPETFCCSSPLETPKQISYCHLGKSKHSFLNDSPLTQFCFWNRFVSVVTVGEGVGIGEGGTITVGIG